MKKFIITEEERKHIMGLYEQTGNPNESQMIDYVKTKWGADTEIEQNSAFIEIINNKTGSTIKFDTQKDQIYYNKNFAIDPNPIPINSNLNTFKKWFDSHNNYNPLSGVK